MTVVPRDHLPPRVPRPGLQTLSPSPQYFKLTKGGRQSSGIAKGSEPATRPLGIQLLPGKPEENS